MDSVFRRFFGLPSRKHDETLDDDLRGFGSQNPGFGDFQGFSIFQHFDRLFADMNDMFSQFESATIHDSLDHDDDNIPKRFTSPRDELLKQPDGPVPQDPEIKPIPHDDSGKTPFIKRWRMWPDFNNIQETREDNDIDEEIRSNRQSILDLTPSLIPGKSQNNGPRVYSSSVTSITIKSDGKVEQRRTVRDIHGNVETTITQSDGNITTWKNGNDKASKEFITGKPNESPDDLCPIKKLWSIDKKPSTEQDPSYERIFKNLFSGFFSKQD